METALLIIFGVLLVICIIAAAIWITVFWILMLVDAVKRSFKSDGEKIAWVLIIIFLHVIGALVYYFAVKKEDNSRRKRK